MSNLLISLIYLLLTFTITVLCYKKYGKNGIYIWMCVSVIICNIQTIKTASILDFTVSLGNVAYGAIFLCTDILSEKYGIKAAKKGTTLSFMFMIVFTLSMQLFLMYDPASSDFSQESLNTIFSCMPRITIASLTAYYISQTVDAKVYKVVKEKFNKVWLSNNVSTVISQMFDSIIFVSIAFSGLMSFNEIVELIITMIIFKFLIAFLDTPFMLIVAKINCEELE